MERMTEKNRMIKQLNERVRGFKDVDRVFEILNQIQGLAKQTKDFGLIYKGIV